MRTVLSLAILWLACARPDPARAQTPGAPPPPVPAPRALTVPRIAAAPVLADFVTMAPDADATRGMARADGFVQRWPADGQPEKMRTVAYLGYTSDALHVVYLAFDPDPSALRAHLVRREEVFAVNDDAVELRLDTYGDRRQSYYLVSNPLGVQLDASWPEVGGQYDDAFDLVWASRGQVTSQGFVVLMSVPFKSLRFRPDDGRPWGIYLGRWIPRTGEWTFWPHISIRQQSYLGQMARLEGLRDLERGSGFQLIPYASWRAFEAIDARDPFTPRRVRDDADPRLGVDAKVVLKDAMVLDVTANPDFSQVESDEPQITTNQRFEVFFPEKRPFFLENAGLLQTPINVFFSRRIADPKVGARLTGRPGAWNVGMLVSDDKAPGARLLDDAPGSGQHAGAAVVRLNRNVLGQSSLGGVYTQRVFHGRDNVVAGLDGRLRFGGVWTADGQWIASRLVAGESAAARSGGGLDWRVRPSIRAAMTGATSIGAAVETSSVTLRPGDGFRLAEPLALGADTWSVNASTSPRPAWSAAATFTAGDGINFQPVGHAPPSVGDATSLRLSVGLRPVTPLRIENTWLRATLDARPAGARVFTNHIVRTQWSWQFTREWSLRVIAQYDDVAADAATTTIVPRRTLNADALLTRLVNPWTALYVGYNRNARDRALTIGEDGLSTLARANRLTVDAWQVFVKWSHLLRW